MSEKNTNSKTKKSMNKELQNWLKETKDRNNKLDDFQDFLDKKPVGKCQVCGENKATSVCIKCGKSVCKSCYFKLIRVCKKCVPPEIAGKWDGSRPDWEKKLGVEWVE